jgi:hypothetical protein
MPAPVEEGAPERISPEAAPRVLACRLAPFKNRVVHRHKQRIGDWYVGRPTIWGNPHKLSKTATIAERQACVLAYARTFAAHSPAMQEHMVAVIREKLRLGFRLVCHCAPKLCHAQVLVAWAQGQGPKLLEGIEE